MINEAALKNKCEALKTFQYLNPDNIEKLVNILKQQDDWGLLRINPLYFAEKYGFEENECIEIFIHGAKIGLFDFFYNMICPVCSGIVHHHDDLDQLEEQSFYCQVCSIDVPAFLDGQVEVAFIIHPDIKKLQIDPLKDHNCYFKYHFSDNYKKPDALLAYFSSVIKGFHVFESDETFTCSINGDHAYVYQFINIEYNTACRLFFDKPITEEKKNVEIILLPKGFTPNEIHLPAGTHQVRIRNLTKNRLGFLIHYFHPEELMKICEKYSISAHPFLNAGRLINSQSFRDLFRVQNLSESLGLNVKNLTVMFTDLKGSTSMYDKAGDAFAYKLIREHFSLLFESVRKYSGAIVKTMGDAVMAAFVSPLNGFLCALDMIGKIDKLNEEWKEHGYYIGLKVGLNNGPALTVVNDERLDYFGQTINIAARIQGLAHAGEIYVSDSIYHEADVEKLLEQYGCTAWHEEASLKGVGLPQAVYKICSPCQVKNRP